MLNVFKQRSVVFGVVFLFVALAVLSQSYGLYLIQHAPGTGMDQLIKSIWSKLVAPALGLYAGLSLSTFIVFCLVLWTIQSAQSFTYVTKVKILFSTSALILLMGAAHSPYKSIDVFSYAAHGHLSAENSMGAYQIPAAKVVESEFGKGLQSLGWSPVHGPSPYGPIWTLVEMGSLKWGSTPAQTSYLLKVFSMICFLLTGLFVLLISQILFKEKALWFVGFFLLNPFFWGELGWEGHNDSLMLLFFLMGVYVFFRNQKVFSVMFVFLSVLTKYIPILVLPALLKLIFSKTEPRNRTRLALVMLAGAVAVVFGFYAPFGWDLGVFDAVKGSSSGFPFSVQLVSGTLAGWGFMEAASAMPFLFKIILLMLIVLGFINSTDMKKFLEWSGIVFGFYFFIVSPAYWNWYLALPATLLLFSDSFHAKTFLYISTAMAVVGSPLWHLGLRNIIPFNNAAFVHQILCPGLTALAFVFFILGPKIKLGIQWYRQMRRFLFTDSAYQNV